MYFYISFLSFPNAHIHIFYLHPGQLHDISRWRVRESRIHATEKVAITPPPTVGLGVALVVVVGFVPCVKPLGVVITGRDVVVVDFVVITLCTTDCLAVEGVVTTVVLGGDGVGGTVLMVPGDGVDLEVAGGAVGGVAYITILVLQ